MMADREHTFYISHPKSDFVITTSAQVSHNLECIYNAFDDMPGHNKMLFFDFEYCSNNG